MFTRSPASFLSGRMAIRLPPAFTQLVSADTCDDVRDVSPSSTTSNPLSADELSRDMSSVVNASRPSLRRISVVYVVNGFDADVSTRIGVGLASVVKDDVVSDATGLPARSAAPPAPPLTVNVYVVPNRRTDCGVSVAMFVDELKVT